MKKFYISLFSIILFSVASFAGNKDRSGQAGAGELLINPWARSAGWGGVNTSNGKGIDALHTNVAGLAFVDQTEVLFSYTSWLGGASLNNFGLGIAQKIGEANVVSLSFVNMSAGEIATTTEDTPDGNGGILKPSTIYINASYARKFSDRIYGGINFKVISTSTTDIGATGIGIDAGIQYLTGENENMHFGIAVKNWGPAMSFKGSGDDYRAFIFNQPDYSMTIEQRSAQFELPTCINIGAAYDFLFKDENGEVIRDDNKEVVNRITVAANYTSNAFSKDQAIIGLEYGFRHILMVRAGFVYEQGIFNSTDRTTAQTGLHAGLTLQTYLDKDRGSKISLEYAYRTTNPFGGIHSIGARISL